MLKVDSKSYICMYFHGSGPRIEICSGIPVSLVTMTLRHKSDTDLESQNLDDLNEKLNLQTELQKIKSAGAVTISSELFEKVHTL
jgi:hypothetical protein